METAKKQSKTSIIAVILIVAAVACGFAISQALGQKPDAGNVVVHDGEGGVTEFTLDGSQDGEHLITTSLGYNAVVIENGAVHVRDADCENHDCVKQGSIGKTGEQIVCLPHKLWIEVADTTSESDQESFDIIGR